MVVQPEKRKTSLINQHMPPPVVCSPNQFSVSGVRITDRVVAYQSLYDLIRDHRLLYR